MTWNLKSLQFAYFLVSIFQVSATFFVTTWPFCRWSKCLIDAQSDAQKINIFLYLTFTSISSLHREERNFSQLGIPLSPCSKIIYKFKSDQGGFWFLVQPLSTWANTWHSHISIHCEAVNLHRSPYILPFSRAHGLFRGYSGVLGKSSAWNVGNCAYAPRHLETFCCCSAWYTTGGNSERLSLDHLQRHPYTDFFCSSSISLWLGKM